MSVQFGEIVFDSCSYDAEGDVLYLRNGPSADAVEFDACAEGHHTRFDAMGALVGLTILNARLLLAEDGEIVVTLPDRVLRARDLGDVLTAA
jgi:hypothetical protein